MKEIMCFKFEYKTWLAVFSVIVIAVNGTGNVLDVTCVNPNPLIQTTSIDVGYEGHGGSVDKDIILSFGRSVDTGGPGTNGSYSCHTNDNVTLVDCGLPAGTLIETISSNASVRVSFDDFAESERIGVFDCHANKLSVSTTIRTIILDAKAEILPVRFTKSANVGDNVILEMNEMNITGEDIIWRFKDTSGDSVIIKSGNDTSLTLTDIQPVDGGVYECYHDGKVEMAMHGIMSVFVRACRSGLWDPPACDKTCPDCYNGGVCDDSTGVCVCAPGFAGDFCEKGCGFNHYGHDCLMLCDVTNPSIGCRGKVFCISEAYGCSCASGYHGLDCSQDCADNYFGAGCVQQCHCPIGSDCDPTTGMCSDGICVDDWLGPQCQLRIIDATVYNRSPLVNTSAPTIEEYRGYVHTPDYDAIMHTGRLGYTGTGDIGLGVQEPDGLVQIPRGSGFPNGSTIRTVTRSDEKFIAVAFLPEAGSEVIGTYYVDMMRSGALVKIATFKSAAEADVWPDRYTTTIGVGELAILVVYTSSNMNQSNVRWRHNDGDIIEQWNGLTIVNITNVRKSDEGIYECYDNGSRSSGKHAVMRLIVRDCPRTKWGTQCDQDCPVCYNGGICDHKTGQCICPPGFSADDCSTACGDNNWGRNCGIICSGGNPGCPDTLFCVQDPIGCSCIAGYYGNDCLTKCAPGYYGAGCDNECHCEDTDCDPATGCPDGSCLDGYMGPQCQVPEDECPQGYYGMVCTSVCHCLDGVECNRDNGTCTNGCADGWAGNDCQHSVPYLHDDPEVFEVFKDSATISWNSWRNGYDYGTGPIVGYVLEYKETGSSTVYSITTEDSIGHPVLSPFTDYEFRVQTRKEVDGFVVGGAKTDWVAAKTLCGVPVEAPTITNTESDGPNEISFTWSIPVLSPDWLKCDVDSFTGYAITVTAYNDPADTRILYASTTDTSKHVYNLMVCTVYVIHIRVTNTVGEGPDSLPQQIQTDSIAPSPIDRLEISTISNTKLNVKWTTPESTCEVTEYDYKYRLVKRDQCQEVDGQPAGSQTSDTEATLNLLEEYSTYHISVVPKARGVAGNATYGMGITDEGVPRGVPTEIEADDTKQFQLTFTWSQPECGSRQGNISNYDCLCWEDAEGAEQTMKSTDEAMVIFTEDINYFTWYNFTVRAKTPAGDGPYSDVFQVLSAEGAPASSPRNVTIVNSYTSSFNLSWLIPSIPNGIVNSYVVLVLNVDTSQRITYTPEDTDNLTSVYFEASGLVEDQTYRIEVKGVTSAGEGPMSDPVIGRTLPVTTTKPTTTIPTPTIPTPTIPTTIDTISTSPIPPPGPDLLIVVLVPVSIGLLLLILIIVGLLCMYYRKRRKPRTNGDGMDFKLHNPRPGFNGNYEGRIASCTSGLYEDIPDTNRYTITLDDYGKKIYDGGYISPNDFQASYAHELYEGTYFVPEGAYFIPGEVTDKHVSYGPITIGKFPAYVKQKKIAKEDNFCREFSDLVVKESQDFPDKQPPEPPPRPDNPYETKFETKQNTYDNRINNVSLTRLYPGINAVIIHGHKKPGAYISSSGPTEDNVDDWWYMIWERRVVTIVMNNDITEQGEIICEKYWPDDGELKTYGTLSVQSVEEDMCGPHTTMRTFELTKEGSEEVREIKQFHISDWPSHEGPMFIQPVLVVLEKVKASNPAAGAPILVHCGTGSGRTGVVIAIDAMLDMMRSEGKIGAFDFIKEMRKIRYQMVETEAQHVFIYDALLEAILARKTRIRETDFIEVLAKLTKIHTRTQTSHLDDQFLALECIIPIAIREDDFNTSFGSTFGKSQEKTPSRIEPIVELQEGYINVAGPQGPKVKTKDNKSSTLSRRNLLLEEASDDQDFIYIPRPAIPGETQGEVLDVAYVEGFGSPKAFLVMASPEKNVDQFWQCIYSSNSQAIVMLGNNPEENQKYWPETDAELVHSPFTVELVEEKNTDCVTERLIKLTINKAMKTEESRHIKQFQFLDWHTNSAVPNSAKTFLALMNSVARWQTTQAKENPRRRRITVHCSDGSKSGLFCVLANVLDQMQVERIVDIYQNVKKLRTTHTDMLNSKEQFIFIYECIRDYVSHLPTYGRVHKSEMDSTELAAIQQTNASDV